MYSRVGGGHFSAARALAAELDATGRCQVRLVDAYVECGRFPVTLFPPIYARLTSRHPRLWSAVYSISARRLVDPAHIVGSFLRDGFKRMLSLEQPQLVISALPVVNGLLADALGRVSARLEVVLTDWHAIHPYWVARGVDHYTAATDSARQDCIRFGAEPDAVDVVGIPVRREFATSGDPVAVRSWRLGELGLDPERFTILAMAGAEGSPRTLTNLAQLATAELPAQLVVVCGKNAELRCQVERLATRMPLKALGFVDDVADLMRVADVLVTKAGGLTLAEAFCCGVPVVIHDVLPGQETGNLEYVLQHGAVEYARGPKALVRKVGRLARDPARRALLAERGARLGRPDAAQRIAANILERAALI